MWCSRAYTAISTGENGYVKVRGVFDEDSIVSIEVLESNETDERKNNESAVLLITGRYLCREDIIKNKF